VIGTDERACLRRLLRSADARLRLRARIAWHLAHGLGDASVAQRLHVSRTTVQRVRRDLARRGSAALDTLPRRGRPCVAAAARRQRVLAAFRELCRAAPQAWPSVRAVARCAGLPRSSTYRLLLELALAAPARGPRERRRRNFNPPN